MEMQVGFHHVGVACENIDATAAKYEELGYKRGETILDSLQNVNICFLTHPKMPCVELLAPVDENSPVVQILKRNGTTPYHFCYTVDDIEVAIKEFRKDRYMVVSKPKQACAIGDVRVAFMFHKDMGLIELVGK